VALECRHVPSSDAIAGDEKLTNRGTSRRVREEVAVMHGMDHEQSGMFSCISAERRVSKDHPLRATQVMVDAALKESSWRFDAVYASSGRPSIAPEELPRALLLQTTTRQIPN
jgi:hypothetical protein